MSFVVPMNFTEVSMDDVEGLVKRHMKSPPTLPGRWNLRANVDGPWLWRDPDDFGPVLTELSDKMKMLAGMTEATIDELERATALYEFGKGVHETSAWTLGTRERAPLRGPGPYTVSDAAVDKLLLDATHLARVTPKLRYYGAGVRAWLLWIVGASDRILYPQV